MSIQSPFGVLDYSIDSIENVSNYTVAWTSIHQSVITKFPAVLICQHFLLTMFFTVQYIILKLYTYVTKFVKSGLIHTSDFATLKRYNFISNYISRTILLPKFQSFMSNTSLVT